MAKAGKTFLHVSYLLMEPLLFNGVCASNLMVSCVHTHVTCHQTVNTVKVGVGSVRSHVCVCVGGGGGGGGVLITP